MGKPSVSKRAIELANQRKKRKANEVHKGKGANHIHITHYTLYIHTHSCVYIVRVCLARTLQELSVTVIRVCRYIYITCASQRHTAHCFYNVYCSYMCMHDDTPEWKIFVKALLFIVCMCRYIYIYIYKV